VRAIDTNVVVRFLIADDKQQAKKARGAIESGDIFISSTVLLETEWVLRSGYGLPPDRIAYVLRSLAGLPGITVDGPAHLSLALDWMDDGMDFADAMHLARAEGCDAFLSFDRKLAKVATGRSSVPVEMP
jgi:predicted nucleic-acid-binding protein